MSENHATTQTATAKPAPNQPRNPKWGRKKLKTEGRKKRRAKLASDTGYKKAFFEARSKRANDKKAGFRKKKSGKK